MASKGIRQTRRRSDRETYWCECGASEHQVVLWASDSGDPDYDTVYLEVGFFPNTLRERLRDAWRCLRGRPAPFAEVILNYAETRALREGLSRHLVAVEARTEPDAPEDRN